MIEQVKEIAKAAGREIIGFYGQDHPIETKSDDSPLTRADVASHKLICSQLPELTSDIPILSEESAPQETRDRLTWRRLWLVDPLDGTKEFIKQTGQFTVNIALIESGEAVMGVVYAPAIDVMYWAEKATGAYRQDADGSVTRIRTCKADRSKLSIVASRDHAGPQVAALLERFPSAETRSMGSSLKFCLVAEGQADLYLRDVPTMEWDTAAAQCIVETAGGVVQDLDGERLTYNKANLTNPLLITLGDSEFAWRPLEDPTAQRILRNGRAIPAWLL